GWGAGGGGRGGVGADWLVNGGGGGGTPLVGEHRTEPRHRGGGPVQVGVGDTGGVVGHLRTGADLGGGVHRGGQLDFLGQLGTAHVDLGGGLVGGPLRLGSATA